MWSSPIVCRMERKSCVPKCQRPNPGSLSGSQLPLPLMSPMWQPKQRQMQKDAAVLSSLRMLHLSTCSLSLLLVPSTVRRHSSVCPSETVTRIFQHWRADQRVEATWTLTSNPTTHSKIWLGRGKKEEKKLSSSADAMEMLTRGQDRRVCYLGN